MKTRDLILQLSTDADRPLYVRVAEAIVEAIRLGRLKPGDPIPGTRALSDALGINRNTVVEALDDLTEEGWLRKEPSRGTFVADPLPETSHPSKKPMGLPPPVENNLGFDLPSHLAPVSSLNQGLLDISDGFPSSDLFPKALLAGAYQRGLQRHGTNLLDQGDPQGHSLLREVLADWYTGRRGLAIHPSQVLITRGTRASLTLLCMALLKDGETVAVENPGNRSAWETIKQCVKVELAPIPVDQEGLIPDALESLLVQRPIRMLYLTPQRQIPTNAVLSNARRAHLLQLAAKHRIVVVEDDASAEYIYEDSLLPPLAAQDNSGQVIFMASMARLMASGLRLGILVGPKELISRLARVQRNLERQGDRSLEWAVADLIRDGELDKHLRRARLAYRLRRDHLLQILSTRFGNRLLPQPSGGGLALWLRGSEEVDLDDVAINWKKHSLLIRPPAYFFLGEPLPFIRMGFSQITPGEMDQAMDRLGQVLGGEPRTS
jgi:GntR family transcriptional regulator/MocR family aminotransferase